MAGSICDIPGYLFGAAQDNEKLTGVSVLLCPKGTVGGIDIRGAATSTRQVDSLKPHHLVGTVNAICFAGGSAFGLDSAAGVMKYLAEKEIGLNVGYRVVPIVPTAVIFDVALGNHQAFPTPEMAYEACENAKDEFVSGSVGAGCGASVGKVFGITHGMKGGQGTSLEKGPDGLLVAAFSVVNAYGDIIDPKTGHIKAGARKEENGNAFANTLNILTGGKQPLSGFAKAKQNTVLTVIATNARFDKEQLCRIAKMAHCGLARVICPCHSAFDGDVAIALSSGKVNTNENTVGALGAKAVEGAIMDAMESAKGFGIIPDCKT